MEGTNLIKRIARVLVWSLPVAVAIATQGSCTPETMDQLEAALATMPPDAPAIVIAQHIPEMFSAHFAARLNRDTNLVVREASPETSHLAADLSEPTDLN